jgi:putative phosphoesterase
MKIAILSDIHSNVVALEAVLEDLGQQRKADHILVTGDMFAFGAAPNEVLALLRQLPRARFLRGNAERYLLEGTYPTARNGYDWRQELLLTFRWTAEQLGPQGLAFLTLLPSSLLIPIHDRLLLAVHGSPRCDEEGLTLQTEASEFEQMKLDPRIAIIVCGHTHIPMDRRVGHLRVVNAGSVGIPFDGDPRASYALISTEPLESGGPIQVEIRASRTMWKRQSGTSTPASVPLRTSALTISGLAVPLGIVSSIPRRCAERALASTPSRHFFYHIHSSSMSPIRTVSPGRTPASRKASNTPIASSTRCARCTASWYSHIVC